MWIRGVFILGETLDFQLLLVQQVHSFSGEPPVDGAGSGGSPSQNKKEENLYDWMRRLQAQGSTGRVKGSKQVKILYRWTSCVICKR